MVIFLERMAVNLNCNVQTKKYEIKDEVVLGYTYPTIATPNHWLMTQLMNMR